MNLYGRKELIEGIRIVRKNHTQRDRARISPYPAAAIRTTVISSDLIWILNLIDQFANGFSSALGP